MSADSSQQTMERVPEAELMDDAAQAKAYAEADFSNAEQLFIDHFRRKFLGIARSGMALDLGCGPGNIAIAMAEKVLPLWRFDAVDGSREMLLLARNALVSRKSGQRIHLMKMRIPDNRLEHPVYDAVFCNSLLHHLKDPQVLWRTIKASAKAGAPIQVMDLIRPDTEAAANELVRQYLPADASPLLKRDFIASLRASYRLEEVQAQLEAASLGSLSLDQVSDRHWIASGVWKPVLEENFDDADSVKTEIGAADQSIALQSDSQNVADGIQPSHE